MKIKKIKNLLEKLYVRGIFDGQDTTVTPQDKFLGNIEARKKWEKEQLDMAYKELRFLITLKPKGKGKK